MEFESPWVYDEGGAIGFIIMEKCPGMAVGGFSGHFFFYIQSKGLYKGQGIAVILVHIMLHSESARDGILAGASAIYVPGGLSGTLIGGKVHMGGMAIVMAAAHRPARCHGG